MVEPRWSIKCMNSTLNLFYPCTSFADLKKLHKKYCKKYFCLCKRHTISVICINETRKLYWFNCKNVREKVNFGLGDGYYYKLLRIINGALNTWAQRYIDGLSIARREIMFRINGTAEKNMKLLKEGCYCHYHPHMTADACNADFLKKVVSFWAGEGLRGIREKLRGMTNYAKKVREASELSAFLFYSFLFPLLSPPSPLRSVCRRVVRHRRRVVVTFTDWAVNRRTRWSNFCTFFSISVTVFSFFFPHHVFLSFRFFAFLWWSFYVCM